MKACRCIITAGFLLRLSLNINHEYRADALEAAKDIWLEAALDNREVKIHDFFFEPASQLTFLHTEWKSIWKCLLLYT